VWVGTCNSGKSGRSGREVGDVSEGSRLECERTCSKTRDDEVAGEAAFHEFPSLHFLRLLAVIKKWVSSFYGPSIFLSWLNQPSNFNFSPSLGLQP